MANRYGNVYWRGGGGVGAGANRLSAALRGGPDIARRAALLEAQTEGQLLENTAAQRSLTAGSAFTDALTGFDATDPVARRRLANLAAAAEREGALGDVFTAHSVGNPELTAANLAAQGKLKPDVAVSQADRDELIANAAAAEQAKALAVQRAKLMTVSPGHSVLDPANPGAGSVFTAPDVITPDVDQRVVSVVPGGAATSMMEPDLAQVAAVAGAGGGGGGGKTTYQNYYSPSTGQTVLGRVEGNNLVDRTGQPLPPDAVKFGASTEVGGDEIGITKPTISKQEQSFDAHDKMVSLVEDIRDFAKANPGVTGLVGSARRGISGVFGQLQDISDAVGWSPEQKLSLEERANAIQAVMPKGEPGSQAEAASVFLLKMLDLAYTRAKAFDQGGRLSDQDLQRQLEALGGGALTSSSQFLEKMDAALDFSTRERERLAGNLGAEHPMVQAWRTRPTDPVLVDVPDDVVELLEKYPAAQMTP